MLPSIPHSLPAAPSPPMSKTSIGYITSPVPAQTPGPVSPAPGRTSSLSGTAGTPTTRGSPSLKVDAASLSHLPPNVLSLIAYHIVASDPSLRPSALGSFLRACRTLHHAASFEENPKLYHDLFHLSFDCAALPRRYKWMRAHMVAAGKKTGQAVPKPPFDLFGDPRSFALEYKGRWEAARRMHLNVKAQSMVVQGVCDREDMTADLWTVWFLLTENDGRNLRFLQEQCDFVNWMSVYARDVIQTDASVPGFPEETAAKSLGVWIALLSGTDLVAEHTPNQVDEKIFTLRPYIFAGSKYDTLFAPWNQRRLPIAQTSANPATTIPCGIVSQHSKAVPYKRFGYTWRRAPPHHTLGAYLYFLRLLDRQPVRRVAPSDPRAPPLVGLYSHSQALSSLHHDREWQRNSVCQDRRTSPGLPPLAFHGDLQGYWRGKFLFYDFETYRRVLAGDLRAVYTGMFSEQLSELEVHETLVRVRENDVGGTGSALTAGYEEREGETAMQEQERIRAGDGKEVVHEHEVDVEDEPGWTREILLTGRALSTFGWAMIKGRVRAWDGMVFMHIAYNREPMGSWLWRGYLHTGGYMLGSWRDTVSPEDQPGFEGAFGVVRAGDVSYPPHFPRRIDESLAPPFPPSPQAAQYPTGPLPGFGPPAAAPVPMPTLPSTAVQPGASAVAPVAPTSAAPTHATHASAGGGAIPGPGDVGSATARHEDDALAGTEMSDQVAGGTMPCAPASASAAAAASTFAPGSEQFAFSAAAAERGVSRGSMVSASGSSETASAFADREELQTPVTANGYGNGNCNGNGGGVPGPWGGRGVTVVREEGEDEGEGEGDGVGLIVKPKARAVEDIDVGIGHGNGNGLNGSGGSAGGGGQDAAAREAGTNESRSEGMRKRQRLGA